MGNHARKEEGNPMTTATKRKQPVPKRPKVTLVGTDGNAYAVLGKCRRAARDAGWSQEQIDWFTGEATSGDYNKLLATCMRWFDVR